MICYTWADLFTGVQALSQFKASVLIHIIRGLESKVLPRKENLNIGAHSISYEAAEGMPKSTSFLMSLEQHPRRMKLCGFETFCQASFQTLELRHTVMSLIGERWMWKQVCANVKSSCLMFFIRIGQTRKSVNDHWYLLNIVLKVWSSNRRWYWSIMVMTSEIFGCSSLKSSFLEHHIKEVMLRCMMYGLPKQRDVIRPC